MFFESALPLLRLGFRLQREGWNGKGMFIVLQKGYPDGIPINANTAAATGLPEGTVCRFLPYLMMKTADGAFVPWLASQADILADDWHEVQVTHHFVRYHNREQTIGGREGPYLSYEQAVARGEELGATGMFWIVAPE